MLAEPSSFEVFLNYAYPITQMSYWVILSISAIAAVFLFKRFVDTAAGTTSSAGATPAGTSPAHTTAVGGAADPATAAEQDVSIDEFVD